MYFEKIWNWTDFSFYTLISLQRVLFVGNFKAFEGSKGAKLYMKYE